MPNLRYHDQGVAAMEFLPALADGTPLLVSAGVATEGERACRRLHSARTVASFISVTAVRMCRGLGHRDGHGPQGGGD